MNRNWKEGGRVRRRRNKSKRRRAGEIKKSRNLGGKEERWNRESRRSTSGRGEQEKVGSVKMLRRREALSNIRAPIKAQSVCSLPQPPSPPDPEEPDAESLKEQLPPCTPVVLPSRTTWLKLRSYSP